MSDWAAHTLRRWQAPSPPRPRSSTGSSSAGPGPAARSPLAARLDRLGARVLVLDRAAFPSLPQVPSSPIIHAGAMRLLDELGIDEAKYGDDHARQTHYLFEMGTY